MRTYTSFGQLQKPTNCAQAEIEKVRKRREERAAERALQEEELSIMQRERAVLEGVEMEAKEEEVSSSILSCFCLFVRTQACWQEICTTYNFPLLYHFGFRGI